MAKFFALLMTVLAFFVGCTVAAPQFGYYNRPGGYFGGNSAGFGNGYAGNGQAIGTGTGIANTGPGGFGVGLGVGGAISTPFGSQTFGQGNSVAFGKK